MIQSIALPILVTFNKSHVKMDLNVWQIIVVVVMHCVLFPRKKIVPKQHAFNRYVLMDLLDNKSEMTVAHAHRNVHHNRAPMICAAMVRRGERSTVSAARARRTRATTSIAPRLTRVLTALIL